MEFRQEGLPASHTVKMEKVIGRHAISRNAKKIGRIKSVHLNPSDFSLGGITITGGIFKSSHFIDKELIETINDDGVFLKISPPDDFIGKNVINNLNMLVGQITGLKKRRGKSMELQVTTKNRSFLVSEEEIEVVNSKIKLNHDCSDC